MVGILVKPVAGALGDRATYATVSAVVLIVGRGNGATIIGTLHPINDQARSLQVRYYYDMIKLSVPLNTGRIGFYSIFMLSYNTESYALS